MMVSEEDGGGEEGCSSRVSATTRCIHSLAYGQY